MGVEVYEKLEDSQMERVDRLLNRLDRNPHLKVKLDKARQILEAMQEGWDEISREEVKAAKPKRGKRAADPLKG